MGASHRPSLMVSGVFSCLLLLAAVTLTAAPSSLDDQQLSGYTSHEERITEYLFNGEEPHPMWV